MDLIAIAFFGMITSVILIVLPHTVSLYYVGDVWSNMRNVGNIIYYVSLIVLFFAVIRASYRGYKRYMIEKKDILRE